MKKLFYNCAFIACITGLSIDVSQAVNKVEFIASDVKKMFDKNESRTYVRAQDADIKEKILPKLTDEYCRNSIDTAKSMMDQIYNLTAENVTDVFTSEALTNYEILDRCAYGEDKFGKCIIQYELRNEAKNLFRHTCDLIGERSQCFIDALHNVVARNDVQKTIKMFQLLVDWWGYLSNDAILELCLYHKFYRNHILDVYDRCL